MSINLSVPYSKLPSAVYNKLPAPVKQFLTSGDNPAGVSAALFDFTLWLAQPLSDIVSINSLSVNDTAQTCTLNITFPFVRYEIGSVFVPVTQDDFERVANGLASRGLFWSIGSRDGTSGVLILVNWED